MTHGGFFRNRCSWFCEIILKFRAECSIVIYELIDEWRNGHASQL